MLVLFRTLIAPEFASKTDDELSAAFALAEQRLNPTVFGARLNEAVALLAAHRFAMLARLSATGGGGVSGMGPVASMAAGGLSVSFASGSYQARTAEDAELAQTAYGLQFLALRDARGGARLGIA